jgi:SAM-dependent methyltransferase
MYSDADAAALYNVLNPWGPSDEFYLSLVMRANSVLDIGCGTGVVLQRARRNGHTGRLCGVDPDPAMLAIARECADIEWIEGTAASMRWNRDFDLAIMTGHAFQFLVTDDELRASLAAIEQSLAGGGRFAFETRNPAVREWESWNPANPIDAVDPSGRAVRITYNIESVVSDVVTFTETTSDQSGTVWRVDRASLRFLEIERLAELLTEAGFTIESQYGSWNQDPFNAGSREIITVAVA